MRARKIVDSGGNVYFHLIMSGEELSNLRMITGMNVSIPELAPQVSNRAAITTYLNEFNRIVERVFPGADRTSFRAAFNFDIMR
jgi:hypothetical protein